MKELNIPTPLQMFALVMGRCRYLKSVSFFGIFKVRSVFRIGISKYRDIGIGIQYALFKSVRSLCVHDIGHQL